MGQIRPAHIPDELGVPAHHELVASPGQADVEPLLGPFAALRFVDHQNHGATLQPLEAEYVAVEDLIDIPEAVPVLLAALRLPRNLFRVTTTGGQQRNILGPPALFK